MKSDKTVDKKQRDVFALTRRAEKEKNYCDDEGNKQKGAADRPFNQS